MSSAVSSEIVNLETRRLLAGATAVTFSGGVLTLTCMDDLSQAGILAGKNDNVVLLVGGAIGEVQLNTFGEIYTGVTGLSFSGVTKININCKEGEDTIISENVRITGAMTVSGGNGNNTFMGVGGSLGSLSITNLDGYDAISFDNAAIVGAFTVSNGDGGLMLDPFYDELEPGGSDLHLNTMTVGSLSVTSMEGFDSVYFNGNTTVTGATTIKTGVGGSYILSDGQGTLKGALTITNGDGFDEASLGFVSTKSITIDNGDGGSRTLLSTSSPIVGNVTITNLDGGDEFLLGNPDEGATNITGDLKISNGNGASSSDLATKVTGNLSINSLQGFDKVHFSSISVTGTTMISTGGGGSDIETDLSSLSNGTFGGAMTITNGDGLDNINLNYASSKSISISNGNGGSEVNVRGEGPTVGSIAVTSLDGDDKVVIGDDKTGVDSISGNLTISLGNGKSSTELAAVISGSLALTALAGDDEVISYQELRVTGTTSFNFGSGGSLVDFENTNALNFGGAMTVTSADGDDIFKISSPNAIVLKSVTINSGLGDSSAVFDSGLTSLAMDAISLAGGSGEHAVTFSGNSVTTKNVTLNFKGDTVVSGVGSMSVNGNFAATLTSSSYGVLFFGGILNVTGTTTATLGAGNDAVIFQEGKLTGAVTITGNAGDDYVKLNYMTVMGKTNANLSAGDDIVVVNDSVFNETVALTLGAGDDQVLIEQDDTGTKTRFEKAVTVNGDAGSDLITLGLDGDANDFVHFLSTVTVNGGTGIDRLFGLPVGLGGTRLNAFASLPSLVGIEVKL